MNEPFLNTVRVCSQEPELCRGRSQPLELSSEEDCCVVLFLSFFGKVVLFFGGRSATVLPGSKGLELNYNLFGPGGSATRT